MDFSFKTAVIVERASSGRFLNTPEIRAEVIRLSALGVSRLDIAAALGINRTTVDDLIKPPVPSLIHGAHLSETKYTKPLERKPIRKTYDRDALVASLLARSAERVAA